MTASTINRFIEQFSDAFTRLGIHVPLEEVEPLAVKVHRGMEYGQRVYHTSPHALEMCREMNPHQALAGLYHDIVYYQLDGGFPPHFANVLKLAVAEGGEGLRVLGIDPANHGMRMCSLLFDFKEGDILPLYGGLNEFLSAIVAVHSLSPYLAPADMLRVVALIAATVPNWGHNYHDRQASEVLAARIRAANGELGTGLTETAIDALVNDAVVIANRDVAGFAVEDPGIFLYVTWMLIEESNAPLAAVGVYSVQDFRRALQRMEGFLATLDPALVFHSYKNVPDAAEMARLTSRARANLEFSVHYLDAKLASIAIVEALSLETGGDAPVSMFLGDLRSVAEKSDRIEDFLPVPPPRADTDTLLLGVLEEGRQLSSGGSLAASPLSAFLYRCIGLDGVVALVADAKQMFAGTLTPLEFLRRQPRAPLLAIIDGCTRIALSRAGRLRRLQAVL